ncbi:hypothetical protein V6N13_084424 [Hibiscus sabdariffa]
MCSMAELRGKSPLAVNFVCHRHRQYASAIDIQCNRVQLPSKGDWPSNASMHFPYPWLETLLVELFQAMRPIYIVDEGLARTESRTNRTKLTDQAKLVTEPEPEPYHLNSACRDPITSITCICKS